MSVGGLSGAGANPFTWLLYPPLTLALPWEDTAWLARMEQGHGSTRARAGSRGSGLRVFYNPGPGRQLSLFLSAAWLLQVLPSPPVPFTDNTELN